MATGQALLDRCPYGGILDMVGGDVKKRSRRVMTGRVFAINSTRPENGEMRFHFGASFPLAGGDRRAISENGER